MSLNCPVCKTPLRETERESVSIDTCPQCRGVWLDRGELEKLVGVARSSYNEPPPPLQHQRPPQPQQGRPQQAYYDYDDDDYYKRHKHYRPKSKMERIFDIFD